MDELPFTNYRISWIIKLIETIKLANDFQIVTLFIRVVENFNLANKFDIYKALEWLRRVGKRYF